MSPLDKHHLDGILSQLEQKYSSYPIWRIKCMENAVHTVRKITCIPNDYQLRLVAVSNMMIRYIKNPTEEAIMLHKALYVL